MLARALSVASWMAHRAGVAFVDLDHRLEKTIGTTIRAYFEAEGEARFRDLESEVLAEVIRQPGGWVLSTGGGAVLRPANRELLRGLDNVLYLHAAPEEIYRRVKTDKTRPLLQGGRLTAWELGRLGIPYTLITDSMAALVMRAGRVIETGLTDQLFADPHDAYTQRLVAAAHS